MELAAFDPAAHMVRPHAAVIVGMSQSGKTTLLYDLARWGRREFHHIQAHVRPGSEADQCLRAATARSAARPWTPTSLRAFWASACLPGHTSLLLADGLSDADAVGSYSTMCDAALTGRHVGCTVAITVTGASGVGPMLRSNADWVFVTRLAAPERRNVREKWFPFLTQGDFDRLHDTYTADYGCLVLDVHRAKAADAVDATAPRVYWYRAPRATALPRYVLRERAH